MSRLHMTSAMPADLAEVLSDVPRNAEEEAERAANVVHVNAALGGADWLSHLDTQTLTEYVGRLYAARGDLTRQQSIWNECVETAADLAAEEARAG